MMNVSSLSPCSPVDHISYHVAFIIPSVATLGILVVPNAKYALSSENFLFWMTCPQIAVHSCYKTFKSYIKLIPTYWVCES